MSLPTTQLIGRVAIVAFTFTTITVLHGQQAKPAGPLPDALTADPSHYTVLFENAEVRVLRIQYGPNDKGQMHNHPRSITVFLADGNFRVTAPDGQTRVVANKAGDTTMEGGAHLPENLSDTPFEAIRIEMKTAPIGPWTPAR